MEGQRSAVNRDGVEGEGERTKEVEGWGGR